MGSVLAYGGHEAPPGQVLERGGPDYYPPGDSGGPDGGWEQHQMPPYGGEAYEGAPYVHGQPPPPPHTAQVRVHAQQRERERGGAEEEVLQLRAQLEEMALSAESVASAQAHHAAAAAYQPQPQPQPVPTCSAEMTA
jgi:hypothetical protein